MRRLWRNGEEALTPERADGLIWRTVNQGVGLGSAERGGHGPEVLRPAQERRGTGAGCLLSSS